MRRTLPFIAAVLVAGCAPPCSEFSGPGLNTGCATTGEPNFVEGSVVGGNESFAGVVCSTGLDGGQVTVTVSGSRCVDQRLVPTNPIAHVVTARCALPALPPGRYSLAGSSAIIDAPSDGGAATCQ